MIGPTSGTVLDSTEMIQIVYHLMEHGRDHLFNGTGKGPCSYIDLVGVARDGHPCIVPKGEVPVCSGGGLDGDDGSCKFIFKILLVEQIENALKKLDSREYGFVLRAKGIVAAQDGSWIHFDYVPGEQDIRSGSAAITGKLCVIGSQLDESDIAELFGV